MYVKTNTAIFIMSNDELLIYVQVM